VADPSVANHLLADLPSVVACDETRSPLFFIDTTGTEDVILPLFFFFD
jgi:hypothetical protein